MKIGKALVPIFNQIGQFLRDVYFTLYPPPPKKKWGVAGEWEYLRPLDVVKMYDLGRRLRSFKTKNMAKIWSCEAIWRGVLCCES